MIRIVVSLKGDFRPSLDSSFKSSHPLTLTFSETMLTRDPRELPQEAIDAAKKARSPYNFL